MRRTVEMIGYNLSRKTSYFSEFSNRLKNENGKASTVAHIATGNKFIKTAYAMIRDKKMFNPPVKKEVIKRDDPLKKIKYYTNEANKKLAEIDKLRIKGL